MGNSATSGLLSVNFFDFGFLLILDDVLAPRDVDDVVSSSCILLSSSSGWIIPPRRFLLPMEDVMGIESCSSPIKST